MGTELERRFLIDIENLDQMINYFDQNSNKVIKDIRQGYLSDNENGVVRIRHSLIQKYQDGEYNESASAFLTVKGPKVNGSCSEFEYRIPVQDAIEMLKTVPATQIIEKQRTVIPLAHGSSNFKLEFDEFDGLNEGLIILEVELDNFDDLDPTILPAFVGKEITGNEEYANAVLAKYPYTLRDKN